MPVDFQQQLLFYQEFLFIYLETNKRKQMKKTLSIFAVIMIFTASIFAQGFKVKASGEQTFNFADKNGRNQSNLLQHNST